VDIETTHLMILKSKQEPRFFKAVNFEAYSYTPFLALMGYMEPFLESHETASNYAAAGGQLAYLQHLYTKHCIFHAPSLIFACGADLIQSYSHHFYIYQASRENMWENLDLVKWYFSVGGIGLNWGNAIEFAACAGYFNVFQYIAETIYKDKQLPERCAVFAIQGKHFEFAKQLVEKGVTLPKHDLLTTHVAAAHAPVWFFNFLLAEKFSFCRLAFKQATFHGNMELLEYIHEKKLVCEPALVFADTSLMDYIYYNNLSDEDGLRVIRYLHEHKYPMIQSELLIQHGHLECIKYYLLYGIPVNTDIIVDEAIFNGDLVMLQWAIDCGYTTDISARYAVFHLAQHGNIKLVALVIEHFNIDVEQLKQKLTMNINHLYPLIKTRRIKRLENLLEYLQKKSL
jgi:hypothetical protein